MFANSQRGENNRKGRQLGTARKREWVASDDQEGKFLLRWSLTFGRRFERRSPGCFHHQVCLRRVTREHRENLAKVAKQLANKTKEALRRVRSSAVAQARKTKERHSEDTIRLVEKQVGNTGICWSFADKGTFGGEPPGPEPNVSSSPSDSAVGRQHDGRRRQAAGGQDEGAAGLMEREAPLAPPTSAFRSACLQKDKWMFAGTC